MERKCRCICVRANDPGFRDNDAARERARSPIDKDQLSGIRLSGE